MWKSEQIFKIYENVVLPEMNHCRFYVWLVSGVCYILYHLINMRIADENAFESKLLFC